MNDYTNFNRCDIFQYNSGNILLDTSKSLQKLKQIPLDKERRRQGYENASMAELQAFQSLARSLPWLRSTIYQKMVRYRLCNR